MRASDVVYAEDMFDYMLHLQLRPPLCGTWLSSYLAPTIAVGTRSHQFSFLGPAYSHVRLIDAKEMYRIGVDTC